MTKSRLAISREDQEPLISVGHVARDPGESGFGTSELLVSKESRTELRRVPR
jgi:hypothetical protein